MSRSLNKVQLIGNLTKDAETRYTGSGTPVTNFTVATNYRFKKPDGEWDDKAEFHDVTLWKNEGLAQYLTKGTKVYVEGRLETRSWEDQGGNTRYKTEVISNEVILLGSNGNATQASQAPRKPQSQPQQQSIVDDDVPF